jgi:serine/threonine protein kinase
MKYCPKCQQSYPTAQRFCSADGATLSLQDPYHLVGRTLLDKYCVEALIGIGGMGAVYSTHHLLINRRVAFKILLPNLAMGNEQMLNLFEREAKMAGQLDHENIVDIKDAGRTPDGIAYIVMEWLEGPTLEEVLSAQGALSFEHTAAILRQIAAALDAAHAQYIIHRDLKPSNVMLVKRPDGREQVKVLDFGIAKVTSETTLSPVSVAMGTPHYASPEQFQLGGHIDGRADIYSLGVVLYQMLTGTVPFNAPSMLELIKLQRTEPPPPLRQHRPETPLAIEQLISRTLAKDPNERPQSAGEVAGLFERALSAPDQLQTIPQPPAPSTSHSAVTVTSKEQPAAETAKDSADRTARDARATEGGSPAFTPGPAEQAAHAKERRPLAPYLVTLCLVIIAVGIAAYLFTRKPSSPTETGKPTVTPSNPPVARPVPVEVMRYYLEINSTPGQTVRRAGVEPLEAGQRFKFHFVPRERGYLYIIAPGRKNVPTTFLTARPSSSSGVTTNLVEAGADYSFPAGKDNWIGITRDERMMAFTVIFSPAPLATPGFLMARAGRELTGTEQHELTLFRKEFETSAPEVLLDAGSQQSRITVTRPEGSAESRAVMIDVAIKRK